MTVHRIVGGRTPTSSKEAPTITGGMLVLCSYSGRTRATYDLVRGAIMIEVARPQDIKREFEYAMWKKQQSGHLERLDFWRLVSYLPANGQATF